MCVPAMNINNAKPMSARKTSVGWVGSSVPVPVCPMATPAAISPMTMGGEAAGSSEQRAEQADRDDQRERPKLRTHLPRGRRPW
jgi:hypothetical protein